MIREQNLMKPRNDERASLGDSKVNWQMLIKLRNWVVSIINENQKDEVSSVKEAIRCLLLGLPFSGSLLLDARERKQNVTCDDDGLIHFLIEDEVQEDGESNSKSNSPTKKEQAEQQQKRLELIAETDDWKILLRAAKEQIQNVLDPFLKKNFLDQRSKESKEGKVDQD